MDSNKRFLVALSFPGEHREFVAGVANHLSQEVGQRRILYDKFYEAEFARPNLDTHRQALYHNESQLVVVFLCADYERKEWPGLEWRAIRDLIKKKQSPSIMLIRMDAADVSGVFSIDGYVDVENRTPADIAKLIIERLQVLDPEHPQHVSEVGGLAKKQEIPQPIRDAIDRGVDFLNGGHFKKAKTEFQQALTLAEDAKHSLAIVDAKEHLALVLTHFEHDAAGAKELLQSCLGILATSDNDSERAEVLERLARVHEDEGDLELSESLQRQSLAISERLGDVQAQSGTLVGLAWTIGRGGRTDEALDLNRKAYDLLTRVLHEVKQEDTRQVAYVHTVLGNIFFQRAKIYQRKAEPEEAERALATALQWQRKNPPNHELAKLLREHAELKFFRRELNAGLTLLQEAATLYREREMFPEFAECLHLMGRVHASVGKLDQAKKFFSGAAAVAIESGRGQRAAEILLSLAHVAMEQKDFGTAQQLLENANDVSDDSAFQAECLMEQSRLAAQQGREGDRRKLVESAVDLLKADLVGTQPEMDRARTYFTLGHYLREIEKLEDAISCVRKASERFEAAHDAYGVAKAEFEMAGLLDQMGRKAEAREMCRSVFKLVQGKPFFEIAAAVDFSLANFALHDDKDLEEARRFVEHGITLCKDHDLPLLPQMLLLEDELETLKRAGTGAASIEDLLDRLHQQLVLCPTNSEGYVRLWAFCHATELDSALRATLGPNMAIFTDDLKEFRRVSALLEPYRDWSLILPPEKYPENIDEIIPFSKDMLYPAAGVALLGIRRKSENSSTDLQEFSDPEKFWKKVAASPEVRAQFAASRSSTGGTIPRYFSISLEDRAEQFGGATGGVWGNSLALPPAVHKLLQTEKAELRVNRMFFVYYNRGHVDTAKKLWYDLAILQRFRCFPVYREELPRSQEVRVVASCPLTLPVLDEASAAQHKRPIRSVQKALLELLSINEGAAPGKLHDLTAVIEDLADKIGVAGSTVQLVLYILAFNYEGSTRTNPAIVLK